MKDFERLMGSYALVSCKVWWGSRFDLRDCNPSVWVLVYERWDSFSFINPLHFFLNAQSSTSSFDLNWFLLVKFGRFSSVDACMHSFVMNLVFVFISSHSFSLLEWISVHPCICKSSLSCFLVLLVLHPEFFIFITVFRHTLYRF